MATPTHATTGLTCVYNVDTKEAYVGAASPSTAGTAHQAVVQAAVEAGLAHPEDKFVGFAVKEDGSLGYNSSSLNPSSGVGDGTRDARSYAPVLHSEVLNTYHFPDQDFDRYEEADGQPPQYQQAGDDSNN